MSEVPIRSEIWHLDWGHRVKNNREFAKPHFAVCLSADNEDSQVALFCPLTTCKEGDDQGHYAVRLDRQITGKECWALLQHVKSLDWKARAGQFEYRYVPRDEMIAIVQTLKDYIDPSPS